jgi:hypothetical protein
MPPPPTVGLSGKDIHQIRIIRDEKASEVGRGFKNPTPEEQQPHRLSRAKTKFSAPILEIQKYQVGEDDDGQA